jgi:CheY-like chemotaxis protein
VNNPLASISSLVQSLLSGEDDAQRRTTLHTILAQITRISGTLKDLVNFARPATGHQKLIDINQLVSDTLRVINYDKRFRGMALDPVLAPDLQPAFADENEIQQVLLNLLYNAADATQGEGSMIRVITDNKAGRQNSDHPLIVIRVIDNGIGIPREHLERVFDPFFTTKEVGKGTGLGLSMVFGFVKQSGGHIKIYSEEGHGTTVRIYLPRSTGEGESASGLLSSGPVEGGSETVLVVEDDTLVRKYVVAQVASLGYATLEAANAADALKIIDAGAEVDLLFTDVIMPGTMNGRQLVDEALKRRPSLQTLFTSGYTENAILHHGRLDEGVLLLAKPYRKPELARMIRVALNS